MLINDSYNSIGEQAEGLYKDKGSRFISFAYPIESEDEVRKLVSALKKEYHDARHHCYAFRIGKDGQIWRASDDGEPSGSAGRVILGQIDSAALSDVLVVVIRYFGGIKLGIPGLIKAYKESSAQALSSASVVGKFAGKWHALSFSYDDLPKVMKVIKDMDLPQRSQDFGTVCRIELFVRLSKEEDFLERIKKIGTFRG